MNKTLKKLVVALFVAVILLLPSVGTVSADTAQTWYLDSYPLTPGFEEIMYHNDASHSGGSVYIAYNQTVAWVADEQAVTDVTFQAATWSGQIKGKCLTSGYNSYVYARIGSYHDITSFFSEANFSSAGTSALITFPANTSNKSFTISASGFTVPEGDYLAFVIDNKGTGSKSLQVYTDGNSYVSYPMSDPPYPVPDANTIILLGLGILALSGFIWYGINRRKATA